MRIIAVVLLAVLFFAGSAAAQQPVNIAGINGSPPSVGNPLPVSGTVTASFNQFAPISPAVSLTATSTSSNILLTSGGSTASITNIGANQVECNLGTTSGVTASATSPIVLPGGATVGVGLGSNTYLACYATTGSNTVYVTSGNGGVAGFGGSGSSGGGGAVYGPTAVGSAAANPPVLIAGTANAGASGNVQVAKVDSSGNQYVSVTSLPALAAGSNAIGSITNTSFAVTQATATNLETQVNGSAGTPLTQGVAAAGANSLNTASTILQGGAVLSAANGLYSNLLQGNAALSLTNPLPEQVLGQTPFGPVAKALTVTASAYSIGYAEGGTQTISLTSTNGGPVTVANLMVVSKGGSTNGFLLYLTTRSPSWTCTDHTAFAVSATDTPYLVPGSPVSMQFGAAPVTGDAQTYATALQVNLTGNNQDSTAGTNLYTCMVATSAVTPATTSDLELLVSGYH